MSTPPASRPGPPRTSARLRSPAEVVASLPLTLGFTPAESLVLLCLHEPRGRLGLTLRLDLPDPSQEQRLVADVVSRFERAQATRLLVVVYSDQPDVDGGRAWESLVAALARDCPVVDALLVRDGRFWSYLCDQARCCPPEGRPVDAGGGASGVQLLAAEQVLEGRAPLPSREALAASLQGPSAGGPEADRCVDAVEAREERRAERGWLWTRTETLARWDAVLGRWSDGRRDLSDAAAADLATSLTEVHVRDTIAGAALDEPAVVLALLAELARRTPDAWATQVCALYGWVAYCQGGGAAVSIALERALACDPACTLAGLLLALLDEQVSPEVVRRITRDATSLLGQDPGLEAAG